MIHPDIPVVEQPGYLIDDRGLPPGRLSRGARPMSPIDTLFAPIHAPWLEVLRGASTSSARSHPRRVFALHDGLLNDNGLGCARQAFHPCSAPNTSRLEPGYPVPRRLRRCPASPRSCSSGSTAPHRTSSSPPGTRRWPSPSRRRPGRRPTTRPAASATVAAWLVNLLAIRRPELVADLVQLADALRSPSGSCAGPGCGSCPRSAGRWSAPWSPRSASSPRPSRTAPPASKLPLAEVEATLNAAFADAEVAEQVRAGRLLRAASYAGFGEVPRPATAAGHRR